ncbi:MAG: aminotransferase class V-fold PLP-dependent enzyme [Bacteroidetes bacterium]|nr:aminotransferase class V-fold PLP-dependent enzyme [Bacteroidota bacterium]
MKGLLTFAPGPSQIYFTVEDHLREAFRTGIPSISHRSKTFEQLSADCTNGLRELFGVPSDWEIYFVSSATEVWERSLENLVIQKSLHYVNGAFSAKYHEFAEQLGLNPRAIKTMEGTGFLSEHIEQTDAELISVAQNETSTGVRTTNDFISRIREKNPEAILIVDAVSSLPHLQPDFKLVDSVFFSVQKGFGLPAGLGVWMVNSRTRAKAGAVKEAGKLQGTYHTIQQLSDHAAKHQTPSTPNVLGIYLLGKVCRDFLRRGIENIRSETSYKSTVLYQAFSENDHLKPFVSNPEHRSETVIVADTGDHTKKLYDYLSGHGLQPGDGYGKFKATQLRFANFPALSKESFEKLSDLVRDFRP